MYPQIPFLDVDVVDYMDVDVDVVIVVVYVDVCELRMIFVSTWTKVEKEKDGATIKSKKNAEGRKVRLNIFPF